MQQVTAVLHRARRLINKYMPLLGKQREGQCKVDASEDDGGDVDGSLRIEDGGNHIAQGGATCCHISELLCCPVLGIVELYGKNLF